MNERRPRYRGSAHGHPARGLDRPAGNRNTAVQPAIRIVIADDHALVLEGIERLLASEPGFAVVGKATTADQALAQARALTPDVLLLDVSMPDRSGLEVLESLAAIPDLSVLLLTAAIDEQGRAQAFRLGVRGILLKDAASEVLFDGIRAVVAGHYWLWRAPAATPPPVGAQPHKPNAPAVGSERIITQREREVLAALVEGCTNRVIAERLLISEDTVKHHLSSLFDKTGASSRVELAMFAVHRRLLDA